MNQEREWAHANMTSESVNYLNELPKEITEEYKGINIHGFHATPADLFEVVLPHATDEEMKDRLMANTLADVYIYGHIHKPYIRYINGKMVINTGSVGLPFDGLAQPSYVLVDIGDNGVQASIVRVNYDLAGLVEDIEASVDVKSNFTLFARFPFTLLLKICFFYFSYDDFPHFLRHV
ncbi:metallophosphoesterase family protein [Thalassobacillus devorans]|uniref:metallophosphoesterase family protein n=1 Tax=Thalassobacillus devorans TaxID=279813 RepID=UPI000A1CD4B6|nr:metallophosphoesterase family protein [Thalassobacillus devorans]